MRTATRCADALTNLHPGVFSVVMATGIVAMAADLQGFAGPARVLLAAAASALLACWLAFAWRLATHGPRVVADLRDVHRTPGFFTVALITAKQKPISETGIDGSWLLVVVDMQAIAVLAAAVAPHWPAPVRSALAFAASCAWLLGAIVYTWLVTLLLHRALFLRFTPADLSPAWWINMGAMAISTLAGAQLVLLAPDVPLLAAMQGFLRGGTILCWATATWWAPLLIVLNAWKYLVRRQRLHYRLAQWSAVFPLGMYSVATHKLALALGVHALVRWSEAVFWIALLAWLAAAWGLLRLGAATVQRQA
jgi:tellurite resistance protein TehA-like permease